MRVAAGVAALLIALQAGSPPAARQVAVTFDDLPIAGVLPRDIDSSRSLTTRLVGELAARRIPAIGFVNERQLAGGDGVDPARVALLRQWADAGLELGNHGYSHVDLHATPLEPFEADVARGDAVIGPIMREHGRAVRFFRHPYLHTGRDLDTRDRFDRFLAERGYRVAPVTIDSDEYVFAAAFDRAAARGDTAAAREIAAAYVPYMEAKVAYFERNARDLFGREIPQVLLVHANMLNAERFGDLAAMFERRGYAFVPLDSALADPAYSTPDRFVGPGGITWLHRWALTRGVAKAFFTGEPEVPPFVAAQARP
jgi:peptidoglycan/xylan/chitin deacetylase (PgdA/CDA1 family)